MLVALPGSVLITMTLMVRFAIIVLSIPMHSMEHNLCGLSYNDYT